MRKFVIALILFSTVSFAQFQESAYSLGFLKFRVGTEGTASVAQWGYTRGGMFTDPYGNEHQFDKWDANTIGRIDGALTGNFNITVGVADYVDVGVRLPIYYDHAKDYSGEAIKSGMIAGGLGDLSIYGKYQIPHFGPDILTTAAALDLYLPTGWKNVGLRPRHAWFLTKEGTPTYAYTAGAFAMGVKGIATADYTRKGLPFIWNSSLGFVAVFGDGSSSLVYGTAFNYLPLSWLDAFLEFSGEMRLGGGYPISPIVDPMLLTPGVRFHLPFNLELTLGVDIGLRNLSTLGGDVEDELDGCEDYQLVFEAENGRRSTYCYVAHPAFAMKGQLTWTFGKNNPKDADGDGVPDEKDRCFHTPKPIVVDSLGCGIDSDGDHVFDGIDECPETPEGVVVDVRGCPLDTDEDGVPDYKDKCAETPKGMPVDSLGCPLDADKDGVPDHKDQCPGTPEGVTVDANGCPLDTDKDGVPDHKDQCPNTPEGAPVDTLGCPLDTDKDMVPDYKDQCPDTPEGVSVDANGCPLDGDKDKVPDHIDECPNTLPGISVDEKGCPLEKKYDLDQLKKGIQFEFGSAKLTTKSYETLDAIVALMNEIPVANLEVQGHTDIVGTEEFNQKLSENRAKAVVDYFIKKGLAKERLRSVGFGTKRPLADNDTEEGRTKNRRVELVPFEKEGEAKNAEINSQIKDMQ